MAVTALTAGRKIQKVKVQQLEPEADITISYQWAARDGDDVWGGDTPVTQHPESLDTEGAHNTIVAVINGSSAPTPPEE